MSRPRCCFPALRWCAVPSPPLFVSCPIRFRLVANRLVPLLAWCGANRSPSSRWSLDASGCSAVLDGWSSVLCPDRCRFARYRWELPVPAPDPCPGHPWVPYLGKISAVPVRPFVAALAGDIAFGHDRFGVPPDDACVCFAEWGADFDCSGYRCGPCCGYDYSGAVLNRSNDALVVFVGYAV